MKHRQGEEGRRPLSPPLPGEEVRLRPLSAGTMSSSSPPFLLLRLPARGRARAHPLEPEGFPSLSLTYSTRAQFRARERNAFCVHPKKVKGKAPPLFSFACSPRVTRGGKCFIPAMPMTEEERREGRNDASFFPPSFPSRLGHTAAASSPERKQARGIINPLEERRRRRGKEATLAARMS